MIRIQRNLKVLFSNGLCKSLKERKCDCEDICRDDFCLMRQTPIRFTKCLRKMNWQKYHQLRKKEIQTKGEGTLETEKATNLKYGYIS